MHTRAETDDHIITHHHHHTLGRVKNPHVILPHQDLGAQHTSLSHSELPITCESDTALRGWRDEKGSSRMKEEPQRERRRGGRPRADPVVQSDRIQTQLSMDESIRFEKRQRRDDLSSIAKRINPKREGSRSDLRAQIRSEA